MSGLPITTVFVATLGLLAGLAFAGAARLTSPPATRPAATATKPAPAAGSSTKTTPAASSPAARTLQADDLLASFPKNVKLTRNERVTIQGRVLDVRTATTSAGTAVRVALVGKFHNEDDPAHITCTMDKNSEAAALELKPGTIVQVTGAFGGTVTASDRLDLTACHDLTTLPPIIQLTASMIAGHWRSDLAMSGAAFKMWAARGGWAIGEVDSNTAVSTPMLVDFNLDAKGTVTEILHDPVQTFHTLEGTWSLASTAGGTTLKFNMKGLQPFETDVVLEGKVLRFNGPALADWSISPKVGCIRLYGTPLPEDIKGLRQQAIKWVAANVSWFSDPQRLLSETGKFLDNCERIDREFSLYYDGGLLKSKKSTQVCCINNKMFVFEFTPDQAKRTGIASMSTEFKDIRLHFTPAVAEIKVESVTLDAKNTISRSKPVSGKISLRAIHLVPDAHYTLALSHERGVSYFSFDKPIGPDNELVNFNVGIDFDHVGDAFQAGKSVPIYFALVRHRIGEEFDLQVSEPVGMLVDVVP